MPPIDHTCDRSNLRTCRCRQERQAEQQRARRRGDSHLARRDNLRRAYGISVAEYDALRRQQGYRCAICRRHEDELQPHAGGRPRLDGQPAAEAVRLAVDHCHTSGSNRALLCMDCNLGLGRFADDPERLVRAARYLRKHARR